MRFLFLALVISVVPAMAKDVENIDASKQQAATNIDSRIASLQKMKSCIQSASTHDAMKVCRETHRLEMNALQDANIDSRIQKLQERKAKNKSK